MMSWFEIKWNIWLSLFIIETLVIIQQGGILDSDEKPVILTNCEENREQEEAFIGYKALINE